MRKLDLVAATLVLVGGLNWGLVARRRSSTSSPWICGGMEFGETNAASRVVYGLVGLAAVYGIGALLVAAAGRHAATALRRRSLTSHRPKGPAEEVRSLLVAVVALRCRRPPRRRPHSRAERRHRRRPRSRRASSRRSTEAVDAGGSRRRAAAARPVHGVRPHRRRVREGPEEDARKPAGRQGEAEGRAPLPRRPGKVTAADVVKLSSAKTLEGKNVRIRVAGSNVFVNTQRSRSRT